MRGYHEAKGLAHRLEHSKETQPKLRSRSELRSIRPLPPFTQEDSRAQRRALTEKFLSRRDRSEELDMPVPDEAQIEMRLGNEDLPAWNKKAEIIDAVLHNQVTIIVGETGSGKSTQIPQFLMEAGLRPSMTQPRIMAANGVGERIEAEIADKIGEEDAAALVGVHTAENNTTSETTRISVVTDGLRLAQELNERGDITDEVLIVDEVHEWNTNIEVLLALVKRLVAEKPHMRVVIMSATVNAQELVDYFSDITESTPPIIEIEGRHCEVERREEPESTVVDEVVKAAETNSSILVFVPGKKEVSDTIDAVYAALPQHIRDTASLFPLHAKMSKFEQDKVTQSVRGVKIIVATNVAQTSLTIPGVDVVIDSGLERRVEMDEEDITGLKLRPSSKDDCMQRSGRTGRDVNGIYVLTRYDEKSKFVSFDEREQRAPAAILHSDLSRNVLRTTAHGIDFAELDLFHQVDQQSIRSAKDSLYALQAIDDEEVITDIGREMNKYSLSPRYGRMMVEATKPGVPQEIGAYMAAITASIEAGSLQYFAFGVESRWKGLLREETDSDPIAQLDIFMATLGIEVESESFARELVDLDLDPKNVARAQNQYRKICRIIGVDPHSFELQPPTPEQVEQINACMHKGMIENIYEKDGRDGDEATYAPLEADPDPYATPTRRTLSTRSIVKSVLKIEPDVVLADPRYFEKIIKSDGERKTIVKHVAENILPIEKAKLGELVAHLCIEKPGGFSLRGDTVMRRHVKYLNGERLDNGQEKPAEWSPELQTYLIDYALKHPGPAQQELRAIKGEYEELQKLTPRKLPLITQQDLEAWVRKAADENTYSPSQLDNNIRLRLQEVDLSLESILNSAFSQEIRSNALSYFTLNDGSMAEVKYRGDKPPYIHLNDRPVAAIPDDLTLPDGREVYVRISKDSRGVKELPVSKLKQLA